MNSGLNAAYSGLQINPNNDQQTAAFETLCWTHIFHHTSSHWVEQAQIRAFPLVREINTSANTRKKKKTVAYDHTLNRLTFEFVQLYANVIWPTAEVNRAHLTAPAGSQAELKATSVYVRANHEAQARLQRDLGRPCTEQIIVAESTLGRRVREFLKELIRARVVPKLGEYSAEQLLYMVLGWDEVPASLVVPRHPKITSERFPCPVSGCSRIYAWSEALTAHYNLAHAPRVSDTTAGSPAASPMSSLPGDTGSSLAPPTPSRVPSQRGATQTGFTLPDRWTVTQTVSMVPIPSSIAAPDETITRVDSKHYSANVISLGGSDDDDDEDSDDGGSGLLCSHAGCQLRFPDWVSFELHAQLPHNDSLGVADSNEMSTTNAMRDSDDLHEAMDTSA